VTDPGAHAGRPIDSSRLLARVLLYDAERFDLASRLLARKECSVDMPIVGHSMRACLPDATVVQVALCAGVACAKGDIVVFRQNARIVAHRVVHRAAGYFVTRGDSRLAPDPPVPFDKILGRITSPPRLRRDLLLRVIDLPIILMSIAVLKLSPSLAIRAYALFTFVERQSLGVLAMIRRVLS
jgi:hypothetical protein